MGPQGETGAVGPEGPQGPIGFTGAKGDKGDKGDTGATGPKGDTGPAGLSGITYQQSGVITVPAAANAVGNASCGNAALVIGGGVNISAANKVVISKSFPVNNNWRVKVRNNRATPISFIVYAVCATTH